MKITQVKLGRISTPLRVPFKTALRTVNSVEDVIVELHTDTGAVGYGEAPPTGVITGDTTGAILGAIQDHIAPAILGRDLDEFEDLTAAVQKALVHNTSAKAAVDMAAGSDLRANSYLYVALRGDEAPPAPVVPDEPSPASYRITVNYLEAATGDSLEKPYTRRLSDGSSYDVTARAALEIDGYVIDHVDGETTGMLDRDVVVDVYYVKETQITDPETPTGPNPPVTGPENPDVTIDDGDVPTADLPELPAQPETTDETVIVEGEVPLGDLPQTGTEAAQADPAVTLGLAALVLSLALAGVTANLFRRKEDAE